MSLKRLFFGNWFGQLSSSSGKNPELLLIQKDNAYAIQCREKTPYLLIDIIFRLACVQDSDHLSKQVYKELIGMELLTPQGEVNTEPTERKDFGKHIMNKLAFVPAIRIKQTIIFLFWWAEETQRLKKLMADKEELHQIVATNPDAVNHQGIPAKLLLEVIGDRIARLPSQRMDDEDYQVQISSSSQENGDQPPMYQR